MRQASTLSGSVLIGCPGAAEVAQRAQTAAMEKTLEKFLKNSSQQKEKNQELHTNM